MEKQLHTVLALWGARLILLAGFCLAPLQYFVLTLPETTELPSGKIDGIVVATGGQARIQAGLELMTATGTDRMLITGVGTGIDRAELIKSLKLSADETDLFTCCVELDITAQDTAGNAQAAYRWAADRQLSRIMLVTANYHLPRARYEFKELFADDRLAFWAVSPPDLKAETWYADLPSFRLLVREYGKYILARLL